MNAIILSIGDELVLGQTVDTNSAWLSRQLAAVGCAVTAHVTVADDQEAIEKAICNAAHDCDFLIISGGIGPTPDDLTRQALAGVMNAPLEMNETWLERLKEFFRARGREMPEMNKIQAMIPRGAKMIENTCGTAAGIEAELDPWMLRVSRLKPSVSDEYMDQMFGQEYKARQLSKEVLEQLAMQRKSGRERLMRQRGGQFDVFVHVFVMPGVPKEMMAMFDRDVLPQIRENAKGAVILSRTLHTFGVGESAVAQMLGPLMDRDRNPSVGTTVSGGIVSLRLNARFPSPDEAGHQLDQTEAACRAGLGDLIFGKGDETLAQVVGQMLKAAGKTVTTAESCTGGLLAKMITDVPGSSDYFKQGFVTYSNEAKMKLLDVPDVAIEAEGAVSELVVGYMVAGARLTMNPPADYALAISGIAGPDGGTFTKPVGTVCIALAASIEYPRAIIENPRTFHFPGDREMIRDRSAKMALTMLRYHLLGKPMPF